MPRVLIVCALLIAVPLVGRAADPSPTETVIKLTVQPAAPPRPALKYQLLPELREMNPGNPIQAYMKCFGEQNNFYHTKQAIDDREKWQTMPLNELPLGELRNYGGSSLRQADLAARLDTPDWQMLLQMKKEGFWMLLPDVQQLRELAAALKVRFRAEVAERRFDDALITAKTTFALGRHLGEHPTFIGNLVGIAIVFVGIGPLDEMLQQPGCPNLYWALTDLPNPLIDIRKGAQGDRLLAIAEFALIDEAEPMTEAQLARAVEKARELVKLANANDGAKPNEGPKRDATAWLESRTKDAAHVKAARQRLVEYGLSEERVNKFPPLQVVLLDEKRAFEVVRDEQIKGRALPTWQYEELAAARPPQDGESLFGHLEAAFIKVRRAQARLEQRIGLLRHVEALRMYAAENDGKWPARLADVKVPLPVDPFTGKPFIYKLDGQTAVIQGTPPKGEEKNGGYNVRYEVTIRK
jgi:hypothetical protein